MFYGFSHVKAQVLLALFSCVTKRGVGGGGDGGRPAGVSVKRAKQRDRGNQQVKLAKGDTAAAAAAAAARSRARSPPLSPCKKQKQRFAWHYLAVRCSLARRLPTITLHGWDLPAVQGQTKVILNGVTDSHRRYTQLTGIYLFTYTTSHQLYLDYSYLSLLPS